jgi:class 3 adenylate cyclase/CHASE2 domain-containing sensor protein
MNRQRSRLAAYAGIWLLALVLARAIAQFGLVAPVEYALSDYWHRLAGAREPARHVALVAIDDASLDVYKDDPLTFWTPQVARAVAVLREAGAAVVGLDLMFSISPERWLARNGPPGTTATYDNPLRQEIARGDLVMVASATGAAEGESRFLLPAKEFVLAVPDLDLARHLGLADLLADADGVVRRFAIAPALRLPAGADPAGLPRLSFAALLAARAAKVDPANGGLALAGRRYSLDGADYPIRYSGPPGHIPRLSFAALLAPDALANPAVRALKGRVVIIGGDYAGMNDSHATPYVSGYIRAEGRYMAGAEVHGNIVESLLSGHLRAPLPAGQEAAVMAGFLLAALLLFRHLPLVLAGLALPLLVGAAVLAGQALFLADIDFPAAALAAGLTLMFLGVLGARYFFEERERNRITRLFGRYVSARVVEDLIATGQPPQLGGVRRELTVLFSDIRNFTVISEHLSAEEVVEMLNRYFGQVCQVVLEEGGTIDKFIGDAVMVQFGAPVAYVDHADRAVRTALRIRATAAGFAAWMRERFPDRDLPGFAVGVGLHTGPAVVGNIGSEQRTEYTAIGDTVNAASRIEGKTKELGCVVLASAETLAACKAHVVTGKSQSVLVKGKAIPLMLHEVLEIAS